MESTAPTGIDATSPIPVSSLAAAFATVPDPRRQASVSYPLPAVLALAVAAILCAHSSVLAMAEWGQRQPRELLQRLGFPDGCTPCQSTLHRLFRRLDGQAVGRALGAYFQTTVPVPAERGGQSMAIDGKAQRGRRQYEEVPGSVHALIACCAEHGVVLASEPIEQGPDQAEAELTVAPFLIGQLDWQDRVLTGDALYCQRGLCEQVLAAGGDYLVLVKGNQRSLHRTLLRAFDPQGRPLLDRRETWSVDKGHGRWGEVRHLVASGDPLALPDWPGVAQLFQLERTRWEKGKRRQQVRYGITSLPPHVGTPRRLLALRRGHWLIENCSHRPADVTLGEDASLLHAGAGPTVFAVLRRAALSLLRRAGCHHITAQLRFYSQYPHAAVALLLEPAFTRA